MIVRRRVTVILYINGFFSQSHVNYYATGQQSHNKGMAHNAQNRLQASFN